MDVLCLKKQAYLCTNKPVLFEELDAEELDADEIILDLSVALGLKGKIPNFTNPVLMLGIEKARSKGSLTTQAKSLTLILCMRERVRERQRELGRYILHL